MDKKEIPQYLYTFSTYDFEGDINKLAAIADFKTYWKEVIAKANPYNTTNINLYHRFVLSVGRNYDELDDFSITGYRWETDEEYNKRIAENKKRSVSAKLVAKNKAKAQRQREIALLKTLQEKYKNEFR